MLAGEPTVYIGSDIYDTRVLAQASGESWITFYLHWLLTGKTDWDYKGKAQFIRHGRSGNTGNMHAYRIALMAHAIANPGTKTLQDVSFAVADQGAGIYRLTFTAPADAESLRVKYSTKTIREWLNYDPFAMTFAYSPDTNAAWFAATDVSATATPGAEQYVDVDTGGQVGLTAANFSVKAMTAQATSRRSVGGSSKITGTIR